YFAPSNWAALNAGDTDLGSTGVALLPSLGRAVVIGKEGVAYLLAAGALGGIGGQVASRRVCSGAWGGSAWLDSTVFVPCADGLYALSVTPTSLSVAWRAPRPSLGSPIVSAGAVWAIEPSSGTLYALNPASGSVLYSTGLGGAQHFSTPAATDGFVVAALFRERQRGHRQLERAGHPVDVGILDAVPLERILRAAQQSFRDVFVKARHDDCDVQVTSVQVGRDALLAHSVNYSRWPS